jgi:hypothetical protein
MLLFLNYYVNWVFDHEILGKKFVNYKLRQNSLPSLCQLSETINDKDLVVLLTRSNLTIYLQHNKSVFRAVTK